MPEETTVQLLKAQLSLLTRISKQLELVVPSSPGYRRPLADFASFDWASIGAVATDQDSHGPSEVDWYGHLWTRRSGDGKFGRAIWFSRSIGKSQDGENQYARLITFKDLSQAEPVKFQAAPQQAVEPEPRPAPAPAQTVDNSPTGFWTVATRLMNEGKIDHTAAGDFAKAEGSWAEKAQTLLAAC